MYVPPTMPNERDSNDIATGPRGALSQCINDVLQSNMPMHRLFDGVL